MAARVAHPLSNRFLMPNLLESVLNWLASDTLASRLAGLVLVLVAGVVIAYLARALLTRLMRRVLGDAGGRYPESAVGSARTRRLAVVVFPQTVFWFAIAFTVLLGVQKLAGLPLFETWLDRAVQQLPRILTAVVIVLAGAWAGMLARETMTRVGAISRLRHARTLGGITQTVVTVAAIFVAVNQLGVDLSFLTVVFGIVLGATLAGASLAFGLGAKAMAGNIVASHYVQQVYRVGSIVEIDGHRGTIVNLTGAFVLIETEDGQVCVPAARFSESTSKLFTSHPHESDH